MKSTSRIAGFARASFGKGARLGAAVVLTVLTPMAVRGQQYWSGPNPVTVGPGINVGIGTTSPSVPLSFGQSLGNTKLALYDDGTNFYGLGVQANEFRFHVYSPAASFTFYNAPAGTALVRIMGTGAVGIGTTSPAYTLDVLGNVRAQGTFLMHGWDSFVEMKETNPSTPTDQHFWRIGMGTDNLNFYTLNDAWTSNSNWLTVYRSGSTVTKVLFPSGNIGIGITNPQNALSVAGTIQAKQIVVTATPADYVFDPGYRLQPLSEVASYIQTNRHLPDIPSGKEVEAKGVDLGDMQAKLLAKVEELTLHMIEAERENRELRDRIARLEAGLAKTAAPQSNGNGDSVNH